MKKIIGLLVAIMFLGSMSAMAVTNDMTGGGTDNNGAGKFAAELKTPIIVVGVADFAITAAAAGDYYKVITIPSNCFVQAVWYRNVMTNTAAATYCIGDSASTSTWASAVNMSAANAGTAVWGFTTNNYYAANNYIVIHNTTAATTGKVEVKAVLIPLK